MADSFEVNEVSVWLEENGFSRYADLFRENGIDFEVLPDLTNEDFRELEISLGDRKKLLKAIAQLPAVHTAGLSASPEPASQIQHKGSEADAERRQITVLFCDLVGSTEMASHMDPEDVADAMRVFQKTCAALIEKGGGFVARYQGDAVLAYFGWPRAREDDAERCVQTGLKMVKTVGNMTANDGSKLYSRVGIATGLVMVGELIGEGLAQEKAVVGATPNLAARLESLAEPGTVAISATTARLIGDLFEVHNLGRHELKGFPKPEQVWRVNSAREITSRFGARLRKGLTPLVGRRSESDHLHELWGKAVEGQGQTAVIVGEAGIGKSRLVQSLDEVQKHGRHTQEHYQCHAFHSSTALHPIIEHITRIADIQVRDNAASRLEKLEALLESKGLANGEAVPLIATLLSIHWTDSYPALNLSPQRQGQRLIEVIVELVIQDAGERPLELVFEDIHWADPTTLQVVKRIIERIEHLPILFIVTYRPEYEGKWPNWPNLVVLNPGRLDRRQVRAMVKRIAGGKHLPEAVFETIISTTDGVPLFAEELTKTILESGQLREEQDRYVVKGDDVEISIPVTLRDSLAARLDQLTVGRELAQIGATIGRSFSPQLAGFILKSSEIELREPLAHLCEADILERRGSQANEHYFFKHALFQEVAYRSQLKSRRREIHQQIANALEAYFPEVAEGQPATLARHFEEAGSMSKAAEYLLRAGGKSLHVAATDEAIAQLTRGLELVNQVTDTEMRDLAKLRFQASLGTAYMMAKGWAAPEVEQAYSAANLVSHAATDAAEAIWILWGIWVYRHVRGQIDESIPIAQRISDTAAANTKPGLKLVADMVQLQVTFYSGRFSESENLCLEVVNEFRPEKDRALRDLYSTDLELVALVHHGIMRWIQGEFDDSQRIAESAEKLARSLEHPYSISWALLWGSMPYLFQGDVNALTSRLEEGVAIAREQGFAYAVAMGDIFNGWAAAQQGDLVDGIKRMETGLAGFRNTGAEIAVPHFKTLLAEMQGRNGQTNQALQELEQAEHQSEQWGETWQLAEIYRVRGVVLAQTGEEQAAVSSLERSIDIARKQNAPGWLLRSSLALAQLESERGDHGQAKTLLQPLLDTLKPAPECADYAAARKIFTIASTE